MMESSVTAWPWIILLGGVGVAIVLSAAIAPPSIFTDMNFGLLTKLNGEMPSSKLRVLAFAFLVGIGILTVSFWLTVRAMTVDYKNRIDEAKASALPPVSKATEDSRDQLTCDLEYYINQGFEEKTRFESEAGGELVLLSKFEQDQNQIWRSEGALVGDGVEPARFSVAVVYGEGIWVEDSAIKIRRRGLRRRVHLETVLRDPVLKEIADKNDYILTLGLASNSENEDDDHNWKLSLARAHNLGVAAMRLGWMPPDRIWPQTIGYSNTLAQSEEQKRRMRPVVLIGVIARRSIEVPDVTKATMEIVPIDLVNLGDYAQPIDMPEETRRVHEGSKYLEVSDLNPQARPYVVRTLDAVSNSKGEPTSCSAD